MNSYFFLSLLSLRKNSKGKDVERLERREMWGKKRASPFVLLRMWGSGTEYVKLTALSSSLERETMTGTPGGHGHRAKVEFHGVQIAGGCGSWKSREVNMQLIISRRRNQSSLSTSNCHFQVPDKSTNIFYFQQSEAISYEHIKKAVYI
jgi:hypothetical protein